MEYQLALSSELGLRPADFVATWNEDATFRAAAEARLDTSAASRFNPLLDGTIAVLTTLGGGLATNALYDLIKQALVKRGVHKHTNITSIKKPDGTEIIVINIDEQ